MAYVLKIFNKSTPAMGDKKFGQIMKSPKLKKKRNKTEPRRLHPQLVHDIDGLFSWHLKEQLHVCEQEGRSMLPPLGNVRNAAAACKTYLSR